MGKASGLCGAIQSLPLVASIEWGEPPQWVYASTEQAKEGRQEGKDEACGAVLRASPAARRPGGARPGGGAPPWTGACAAAGGAEKCVSLRGGREPAASTPPLDPPHRGHERLP